MGNQLLGVMFGAEFCRFVVMMQGVGMVAVRDMCMMMGLLMMPVTMRFLGEMMVFGRMLVVLGRFSVMISD